MFHIVSWSYKPGRCLWSSSFTHWTSICLSVAAVQMPDSHLANVCKVWERRLLSSDSQHLGRFHDEFSFLSGHHLWVAFSHDVKHTVEKLHTQRGHRVSNL